MPDLSRRHFTKSLSVGAAIVPLASLTTSIAVKADEIPMVDPQSPAARGLQFMTESDRDQMQCSGCNYYSSESDELGRCMIFKGDLVPVSGWCAAFQPKK